MYVGSVIRVRIMMGDMMGDTMREVMICILYIMHIYNIVLNKTVVYLVYIYSCVDDIYIIYMPDDEEGS